MRRKAVGPPEPAPIEEHPNRQSPPAEPVEPANSRAVAESPTGRRHAVGDDIPAEHAVPRVREFSNTPKIVSDYMQRVEPYTEREARNLQRRVERELPLIRGVNVYRGEQHDINNTRRVVDHFQNLADAGRTHRAPDFHLASFDPAAAMHGTDEEDPRSVVYAIRTNRGVYVPSHRSMLLNRGAEYRVRGVSVGNNVAGKPALATVHLEDTHVPTATTLHEAITQAGHPGFADEVQQLNPYGPQNGTLLHRSGVPDHPYNAARLAVARHLGYFPEWQHADFGYRDYLSPAQLLYNAGDYSGQQDVGTHLAQLNPLGPLHGQIRHNMPVSHAVRQRVEETFGPLEWVRA